MPQNVLTRAGNRARADINNATGGATENPGGTASNMGNVVRMKRSSNAFEELVSVAVSALEEYNGSQPAPRPRNPPIPPRRSDIASLPANRPGNAQSGIRNAPIANHRAIYAAQTTAIMRHVMPLISEAAHLSPNHDNFTHSRVSRLSTLVPGTGITIQLGRRVLRYEAGRYRYSHWDPRRPQPNASMVARQSASDANVRNEDEPVADS